LYFIVLINTDGGKAGYPVTARNYRGQNKLFFSVAPPPKIFFISDYLVLKNREVIVSKRPRIPSANLHGTGCTYASAFACYHCREHDDRKAFSLTSAFMDKIIAQSSTTTLTTSGGNGPLVHYLRKS